MLNRKLVLIAALGTAVIALPAQATTIDAAVQLTDPVLYWNSQLLDCIRLTSMSPPKATRAMAIMHTAVFDALNAANGGGYESYAYSEQLDEPVNGDVAAAVAAHNALVELFPGRAAELDAALSAYLSMQPDTPETAAGARVGAAAADAVLDKRANDGSSTAITYTGGGEAGEWRPTGPDYVNGALAGWGDVDGWAMKSGDQYRADAPPALDSQDYAEAVNEVRDIGDKSSTTRTQEQTDIAYFWADNAGTATPPGHWLQIAEDIALDNGQSTMDNARMFTLLSMSMADSAIAAWDTKYEYSLWRPETAIQEGNTDGNAATGDDDFWEPLLTTPNHPSYVSGHSTFSSAAATSLSLFYGSDEYDFCVTSEIDHSQERCYTSFSSAADEAGLSRIYGGIHYSFDNVAGQSIGEQVAYNVFNTMLLPVPEPRSLAVFSLGLAGLIAARRRRRTV